MKISKLVLTGVLAGTVLSASMKLIRKISGNPSEILLYNVDYIPLFKKYKDIPGVGVAFHFGTCISSAVGLYYILKPLGLENNISPYVGVYSLGGGALYFLSALTDEPPEPNDTAAWIYWTGSHAIFGIAVGSLVKKLN
ncbi:hypothetical protein [Oceanobacillus sp. CAU 1775]